MIERVNAWRRLGAVGLLLVLLFISGRAAASPYMAPMASGEAGWAVKAYNNVGGRALYMDFALTGGHSGMAGEADRILYVSDRDSLQAAVAGDEPVVVVIRGVIDMNQGKSAADYSAGTGYDWDKYQEAYLKKDSVEISAQEQARMAAASRQRERCLILVGANKSILGEGNAAVIKGGGLSVRGSNVIIRNITFEDAIDFFPKWDPQDYGGNWNAEYDSVELRGARNVWVDHCTFRDRIPETSAGARLKNSSGQVRKITRHDGLLDIVQGADFITVSYNVFADHAKNILVGAKENSSIDTYHLNVTFHHNHFKNCLSRSPMVRYGKVHVYNNWYEGKADTSLGTRFASRIVSEGNYFAVAAPPRQLAGYAPDPAPGRLSDRYSLYREPGTSRIRPVNIAMESVPPVDTNVGWSPADIYGYQLDDTAGVPDIVGKFAGAGQPIR